MIEQLPDVELPRPAPVADAGPLDDTPLRPRRDAGPAAPRRQPDRGDVPRHPHRGPPARRPEPRRRARRDRRRPLAPRGDRGAGPGRPVAVGAVRARPRAAQPPPRPVRQRRDPALGAPVHRGRRARRRGVPAVRPRRGAARRADRADRRPARRGARRSSSGRRPARRDRRSRSGSGPRRATPRTCRACSREVRAAADGVLDGAALARLDRAIAGANAALEAYGAWVTGTLADATDDWPLGARALRRAGPAPGVRGPRRRRDPGDRTGAAAGEPRGAAGGGARDRPRRRPAERHRPGQVRRTGHVRRGAGGLPRRHAPRPGLPDRARHRRRSRTTRRSRSCRRPSTCARSCRSPRTSRPPGSTPTSAACTS